MKDLYTMYTDATCYESKMYYPTDLKLLCDFCKENDTQTSFVKCGRPSQTAKEKDFIGFQIDDAGQQKLPLRLYKKN